MTTAAPRPLVSVVTPSLNQGEFIEATIRSVLEQDYRPIEYLVYDGGSTDDTGAILARYAERIQVVVERDAGQADAVNSGFRVARGEIVGWLNSDDLYLPGTVSTAVEYLTSHPDCAAVYGEAHYIDTCGAVIGPYPTGAPSTLRTGCFVCQPAVFMRRAALDSVGYLDPMLQFCMDYDLWLRLAARYEVRHIPVPLACSRLHSAAKSVAQQFFSRREVVRMTHRRLGATPLPCLYGYADLLVRHKLGLPLDDRVPAGPVGSAAAIATTGLLALRFHRRLTGDDLRLIIARLRAGQPLGPRDRAVSHKPPVAT